MSTSVKATGKILGENLCEAVKNNQLEKVKEILAKKTIPYTLVINALSAAVKSDQKEITKALLTHFEHTTSVNTLDSIKGVWNVALKQHPECAQIINKFIQETETFIKQHPGLV